MMNTGRAPRLLIAYPGESEAGDGRFGAMSEALASSGLEAKAFAAGSTASLLKTVEAFRPDIAFCSFFRFNQAGDRTYLAELLAREGVAWIGSRPEVMELALSKRRLKETWTRAGVRTPSGFGLRKGAQGAIEGIERLETAKDFPYIVKPDREGNSRGIDPGSLVSSPLGLLARTGLVLEEFGEALVEKYVDGGEEHREFTAALLGNPREGIVAAVEIRKEGVDPANPGARIVTGDDKDGHRTRALPIAEPALRRRVEGLARRAFEVAGVRDYARCDIVGDGEGLFAIEINGQPMVPDLWFEACAREAGLGPRQYLAAIVLAGIARNNSEGQAFIRPPLAMQASLPSGIYARLAR